MNHYIKSMFRINYQLVIKTMEKELDKLIKTLEGAQETIRIQEKIIELYKEKDRLNTSIPYIPYQPIFPNIQNPNLHYHGTLPCYNNPCFWG